MKTEWQSGPHYLSLQGERVLIGTNEGLSGHTDNGTSVSREEFLNGAFHDHIITEFGEAVLREVLAAVRGEER